MELKSTKTLTSKTFKIKAGIYGVNGTGKTTFGGTFEDPIFLDFDRGLLSLRGRDIPYYDLSKPTVQEGSTEQRMALDWWNSAISSAKEAVKSQNKSIIVDSMTFVCECCILSVLAQNSKVGKNPNFDDWNMYNNKMRDFIAIILNADKHCLFICHEQNEKDEFTGRVWCYPAILGQGLRVKLAGYFDEFYHAEVDIIPGKPPNYKLLARPNTIYTAKSRLLPATAIESYLKPHFNELTKMQMVSK